MNRNRSLIEEVIADVYPLFLNDFENITVKPSSNSAINSSCSLKNEKDKVVFTAAAMGLVKDDIEMAIKDKYLTVFSKNKDKSQFVSNLRHKVYVGDSIDKDKVSANLDRGILVIDMPVQENKKDFKISF
tara:strand:+ start:635 stop:1024 length:390 start_codon:yes stop_codon:yes gene_type:complete